MKSRSSFFVLVAVAIALLASADARADTTWTFTKSPAAQAIYAAQPQPGFDAMVFNVGATGVGLTHVTRMAFVLKGRVHAPQVANFDLVYYPAGIGGPGVVVGSNAGAGFAPAGPRSVVNIDLASPIAVQGDFTGAFALRMDVNGAGASSFFFAPRLQTVTIEQGGIVQDLVQTEDLPMQGDTFYVN